MSYFTDPPHGLSRRFSAACRNGKETPTHHADKSLAAFRTGLNFLFWLMDAEAERLIEKYLRRPEALAKRERQRVDRLLAHDAAAEAFAEFLRTFYQRLGKETDRGRSSQVEEFVEGLFEDTRDSVVQLRPFRPRGKPQSTVLAAATQPASGDRRFLVLTTLEGEQEEVLVRVIGDHKTGQGRVYVLTDPLAGQGHLIVSFPDTGGSGRSCWRTACG